MIRFFIMRFVSQYCPSIKILNVFLKHALTCKATLSFRRIAISVGWQAGSRKCYLGLAVISAVIRFVSMVYLVS